MSDKEATVSFGASDLTHRMRKQKHCQSPVKQETKILFFSLLNLCISTENRTDTAKTSIPHTFFLTALKVVSTNWFAISSFIKFNDYTRGDKYLIFISFPLRRKGETKRKTKTNQPKNQANKNPTHTHMRTQRKRKIKRLRKRTSKQAHKSERKVHIPYQIKV